MSLWSFLRDLVLGTSRRPRPPAPTQRTPLAAPPAAPPWPAPKHRSLPPEVLDLGAFAPVSDEEALAASRGMGIADSIGDNPRRIPGLGGLRLRIIEGGMVAHGYITPEELEQIHAIGARMDELRPTWWTRQRQIQRVRAARAASRAAIRAEKKRQAAERRQQHAEAVAHRKATDIVFLGRGVSHQLHDRRSMVERLEQKGLPVLSSPADLAKAMDLPVAKLRWLAFHKHVVKRDHYVRFAIDKKDGGKRELAAPKPQLAAAQRWVLAHILAQLAPHDAAHGFVAGRSTVTSARVHTHATVLIGADLADFFPSLTFVRVRGFFKALGYSPAVSTILALLTTACPRIRVSHAGVPQWVAVGQRGLPQGACTSPALANLMMFRLDARLNGYARSLGFRYTRYADDLSLSSPGAVDGATVGRLLNGMRRIVKDEGLALRESKTRVQRRNRAQTVTGIVVNDGPRAPRKLVRRLRAVAHQGENRGPWFDGMLGYLAMVHADHRRTIRGD